MDDFEPTEWCEHCDRADVRQGEMSDHLFDEHRDLWDAMQQERDERSAEQALWTASLCQRPTCRLPREMHMGLHGSFADAVCTGFIPLRG